MLSNTLWKCRTTSGPELTTMTLNTQHSVTVQMYRAHGPAVALCRCTDQPHHGLGHFFASTISVFRKFCEVQLDSRGPSWVLSDTEEISWFLSSCPSAVFEWWQTEYGECSTALSADWWPEQVWLALPGETEQMTASSGSEFCDLSNKIRAFTLPGYFICSVIIVPQSVLSSLLVNFWENNNDEILLLLNFVPYLLVVYSYLVY